MTGFESRHTTPAAHGLDDLPVALARLRRVALVGASDDPGRPSHGVMASLLALGVDVVPVTPTRSTVLGIPTVPDLAAVPGPVDVVDVFRRPEHLPAVAAEAVARGDVGVVWNQLGLASAEAAEVVRAAGRGYVEDRCLKVETEARGVRAPSRPALDLDVLLVDLDGTVLDFHAAEAGALHDVLADLGLADDETVEDDFRRINTARWDAFERGEVDAEGVRVGRWRELLSGRGRSDDPTDVAAAYLRHLAEHGELVDGAAEALWWLRRRMRLVAVTNGFDEVQRSRLATAGVTDLFDAVLTSGGMGVAKPDPAVVDLALAAVGAQDVDRRRVGIVGDSVGSDVAAGVAAGIRTALVGGAVVPADGPRPDVTAPGLRELV